MDSYRAVESLTSEIDHPTIDERREIAVLIERQQAEIAKKDRMIQAALVHLNHWVKGQGDWRERLVRESERLEKEAEAVK